MSIGGWEEVSIGEPAEGRTKEETLEGGARVQMMECGASEHTTEGGDRATES